MLGTSLNIIGKSLGHSQVQTTAVYARLHRDPVHASMTKATRAMLEAGRPKAPPALPNEAPEQT